MVMTKDEIIKHFGSHAGCLKVSAAAKEFAFKDALWFSRYLFVTDRDDRQKAHCSRCEKDVVIPAGTRHQTECICPNCGEKSVVYHTWRKLGNPVDRVYLHFFAKSQCDPLAIVCQGILVSINYAQVFKPIKTYQVLNLYAFAPGNSGQIKIAWYSTRPIYDGIVTKSIYADQSPIRYADGWFTTSETSLQAAVVDTYFQYAQCEAHYSYHFDRQGYRYSGAFFDGYVKWLSNFTKYPAMEYFVKLGFINIIEDYIAGYCTTHRAFKLNGKNIVAVLGFKPNKKDIQQLNFYKFRIPIFCLYLKVRQQNPRLANTNILDNILESEAEHLLRVAKLVPLVKALQYLKKQDYRSSLFVSDWVDYLGDCKKLGYDLTNPYYLYPKDLQKAHAKTMKLIQYQENKALDEKISKQAAKIAKVLKYDDKTYLMRPAYSSKELIDEGHILSNCVASYTQRYATGATNILFIRQKNNKETPFYTVEIVKQGQSWQIRQVRGKSNCSPTPKLLQFLDKYERTKKITHEKGAYGYGH